MLEWRILVGSWKFIEIEIENIYKWVFAYVFQIENGTFKQYEKIYPRILIAKIYSKYFSPNFPDFCRLPSLALNHIFPPSWFDHHCLFSRSLLCWYYLSNWIFKKGICISSTLLILSLKRIIFFLMLDWLFFDSIIIDFAEYSYDGFIFLVF